MKFDRNLALELYHKMDKDDYGEVTIDEFVKAWYTAEDNLDRRILKVDDEIAQAQNQMKSVETQQTGNTDKDKGSTGSVDSKLFVTLHSGVNINVEQAVLCLRIGSQRKETDKKIGQNPRWNKDYIFDGVTQDQILYVQLYDATNPSTHQLEAKVPMGSLSDQLKHIEWLDLYGLGSRKSETRIRLTMQYIYSKVRIFV